MKSTTRFAVAVGCATLSACDASNNPMLGRVEAEVSGHQVVVTNCYTMQVADVKSSDGSQSFSPCKNAAVTIKNNMLLVNGESYGQLGDGDRVLVENGSVHIEPR